MARFPVKIAMLELEDQEKFHNRDFIARPSRAAKFFCDGCVAGGGSL